jgi:putative transposase
MRTPEGNLTRVMQHLDGLYTQRFNRLHHRDGALFRGRYKAIVVDKDNYLVQVVRYIHLNRLEAGLVRDRSRMRGAATDYNLRRTELPKWLRIGDVMGEFSSIAKFHEFVPKGNDNALENFYNKGRQSPVRRDEEFRNGLMEKPICVDREHPRYERAAVRPSVDQVLKTLAKRYGLKVEDLMRGK